MNKHFSGFETITYTISRYPRNFGFSDDILDQLDEFYSDIGKGKKSTIKRLERACKKYPHVPQFKNYLTKEYLATGNEKKANEITDQILKDHPGYLFGKLNKAHALIQEDEAERVPEFLGKDLELQALYPERDEFHIDEVLNFYSTTVFYFLETGDRKQAEIRLHLLEELDPDAHATQIARNRLMMYNMTENLEKSREKWEHDQKYERSVKSRGYRTSTQTDQKPDFHHPEIEYLYSNGFDISKEIIQEILSLPKETLVKDLEAVLEDVINRYEALRKDIQQHGWREERHNFSIHAVFLLGELKHTKSLPSIFEILRQGEEFLDFWYADSLEAFFAPPVAALAEGNLHLLDDFLREPANSSYARNIVVSAAEKIALKNPEKQEEVIQLLEDWIRFMLDNEQDDTLLDTTLLGFIAWSCLNLNAERLVPLIRQLYEKNLVPISMLGTWEEVERDMQRNEFMTSYEPFNIIKQYERIRKNPLNGNDDPKPVSQALPPNSKPPQFSWPTDNQPAINPWKDVGRNDPCPCGSGRKYKKCCLR